MLVHQRCHYCGREFVPDSRVKNPKACPRTQCRKARHRQSDRLWRVVNPTIDAGRYPNTRQWLKDHPNYLRRYRAGHPDYVVRDNIARRRRRKRAEGRRADIQDEIRRRKIEVIRGLRGADIQDTMRRQLDGVLSLLAHFRHADIQDVIDARQPSPLRLMP